MSTTVFYISDKEMFDMVLNNKITYFYKLVDVICYDKYSQIVIGKLLEQYNVLDPSPTIISGNYLDEYPTFEWSTDTGSEYLSYDEFDLIFVSQYGVVVLEKNNIKISNTNANYTLTEDEWADVIGVSGSTYKLCIVCRQTMGADRGSYYSQYYTFEEPDDFNHKTQIKPNEWGFESQYFFESNSTGHTTTTIEDHGLTITTNRLRCGYIEDSYVILSPRRENAGKAYLELYFDKPVYSFMFGITLWSDNEGLSSTNCTAVLEVLDENGNWIECLDLLNDFSNGLLVRPSLDRYEVSCPEGIYGLRFIVTSPAVGDRNKGRICIDDIVLNTDPSDLGFITRYYD